jgi:hypothetical protein
MACWPAGATLQATEPPMSIREDEAIVERLRQQVWNEQWLDRVHELVAQNYLPAPERLVH